MRVAATNVGLPFDVAFSVDDDFVIAWIVTHGENNGGSFDWLTGQWGARR
ncbi:hypothetical protein [Bradyrhizobium sp. ORS 86]